MTDSNNNTNRNDDLSLLLSHMNLQQDDNEINDANQLDNAIAVEQVDRVFENRGLMSNNESQTVFRAQPSKDHNTIIRNHNFDDAERWYVIKMAKEQDDGQGIQREVLALQTLRNQDSQRGGDPNNHKNPTRFLMNMIAPITAAPGNVLKGIVMPYLMGGTLEQEIRAKASSSSDNNQHGDIYTERRIAWYGHQLASALAFCHERNVFHTHVTSANVLLDTGSSSYSQDPLGHTLVLSDFTHAVFSPTATPPSAGGTALRGAGSADANDFNPLYAAPELIDAMTERDYSHMDWAKLDAYGVGCILLELVSCQTLQELSQSFTLAECLSDYYRKESAGRKATSSGTTSSFLDLSCIRLPWKEHRHQTQSSFSSSTTSEETVGYTKDLKEIIEMCLDPDSYKRYSAQEIATDLTNPHSGPLTVGYLTAAREACPGVPVSIDNVQLGLLVQRGPDWEYGDLDGGVGSIGVIADLCADEPDVVVVAFPVVGQALYRYRIGAHGKYDVQFAPGDIPDFCPVAHTWGYIDYCSSQEPNEPQVGSMIGPKCMVVAVKPGRAFITTIDKYSVQSSQALMPVAQLDKPDGTVTRRSGQPVPDHWEGDDELVDVTDLIEGRAIMDSFHNPRGGVDPDTYEVVSIQRVQSRMLWNSYGYVRDQASVENWGQPNEKRIFHGTGRSDPEDVVKTYVDFEHVITNPQLKAAAQRPALLTVFNRAVYTTGEKAVMAARFAHVTSEGLRQLLVCKAVFGRDKSKNTGRIGSKRFHSKQVGRNVWALADAAQICPEYIITYKPKSNQDTRSTRTSSQGATNGGNREGSREDSTQIVPASTPEETSSGGGATTTTTTIVEVVKNSPSKMCVVCLEKEVSYFLVPCGHACLCTDCCSAQNLFSMGNKCPECRHPIDQAVKFYGRLVEDEAPTE